MKSFLFFLFLFCQLIFGQNPLTQVDKIYNAIDVFVQNPTPSKLGNLSKIEKDFYTNQRPKSDAEYLAIVILNCNKAYYENQYGQTQNAIKSYEKAWQLFQKKRLSNYDITESCLKPLGNLYTIIGDYDNAENVIKHYYFIANTENNQQQKYAAILNLSNVYQNTGKVTEAIDLLAKTIATENLTSTQKGVLWNNLGNNYFLSNEINPALNAFENSIRLLKSDTSQSETLSNAYRNLASIYCQQQNYVKANANMKKAVQHFFRVTNKAPRKQAKLYYDIALLDFRQGKFNEAEVNLKAVFSVLIPNYSKAKMQLPNQNTLYAETVLLDALDLTASLYLAQNQPKKALESYALSFHIEELFQSLLVYENSKIITQIRNRNRTEKCIEIYNSLSQKEQKSSYIESAFLLAEQTKSVVLKQVILNSKTRSREEKLILAQLQNWNTIMVKEQQKLELAAISKINEAIKKQNELMLLLKSKSSEKANKTNELNLTDLYSKLKKDNAVLVEYFMGSKHIYVFTVTNEKIRLELILNENTTTPKLLPFVDFFSSSTAISDNPSKFNHFSNVAYTVLKLPKKSSNENLIIVPDGILNFVPFEALITRESSTTNFAKMKYLLNDFKIGYSNSADFYLNTIPFKHDKETVLGVFPIFKGTSFELAFSEKEFQNIETNFDGKYLVDQMATYENFKANASTYSILHLSTHASSGDIIEPASIKFYNQEVLYSELYNLNIHPNLVVLSACETGIGKLYKAEGAMSVARGFQFAGAQNLLFSLWKVNDYTTSVLMEKFYANVKNGKSFFDSNHQSKLDFLADESIPNAKKSPYYWSAFVYYGTLEKHSETNYFLWISLLGGLIGLLLLCKILFRKK